ncbi:MAG: MoxR family ATPase [Anaerolineales bacterium]|nr:MoxR family ATPase [Anaerolineales bacterium]
MSCGGNRHKYFIHQAQSVNNPLIAAFSNKEGAAIEALERIFQVNKSAAVRKKPGEAAQLTATAKTQKLFDTMRSSGLKPPTHAKDGLPKMSSRFGYAEILNTLDALEKGKALSSDSQAVVDQVKAKHGLVQGGGPRQVSAVSFDKGGYYRCGNCGRFASQLKGHTCPATASADDLAAMLERRLGLPAQAFRGYNNEALESLLKAAQDGGSTRMIHQLSCEEVDVTLDGIPQAMMSGFTPVNWAGQTSTVSTDDGRLIAVVDAAGLKQALPGENLVQQTAAAYGIQIPQDAPIMRATATSSSMAQTVQQGAEVEISGGQEYDMGHFVGTEFRKHSARGSSVTIRGKDYPVYSRTKRPEDASSARGKFAPEAKNIVVGRTLPDAIRILDEGSIADSGNGQIEVYAANGQLLSAYDTNKQIAADLAGERSASGAQMAAVLASRMLHPENAFDYALIQDFASFQGGSGSPLAAADSAYLSLRTGILRPDEFTSGKLTLGGQLTAQRCGQCGQFVGQSGHNCPGKAQKPAQKPAPVKKAPVAMPAVPLPAPDPAQTDIPAPVQVVMPDDFAKSLAGAVAAMLQSQPAPVATAAPAPAADPAVGAAMKELAAIMAAQQATLDRLTKMSTGGKGNSGFSSGDMQGLSAAITSAVSAASSGAAVQQAAITGGPEKCPKCGQFMSEDHTCPPRQERQGLQRPAGMKTLEQEKALAAVTMPAPDLFLDNVPKDWGGQRFDPLDENLPSLNPEYEMGKQEKTIFNVIGTMLKRSEGGKPGDSPWNRSFGLYGPAGTGKNTIARQIAAALKTDDGKQGLPYFEVNVTPDMDIAQAIGEVVLTTDENGATVSRVRLGPLGLLAASGGVAAVNEIVRSPKLATALQSIIEDGELSIATPEGGSMKIPVHPSAIFISTWNPGYEGDADRPAQAPLSRMTTFKLDYPSKKEQAERVRSFFRTNKDELPDEATITAAVDYWNELRVLTGGTGQEPQVGTISPTATTPGPRELSRFLTLGQQIGWSDALRTVEIICDQDEDLFPAQQEILRDRFEAYFGQVL